MKRMLLLAALCLPSFASAQSVPTMNRRVTLDGPTGLNAAMATKADVNSPVVSNLTNKASTPNSDTIDTSANTDQGFWRWQNNNGSLGLFAVNDARSAFNQVMSCTRNGATPTGCTFNVPITTQAGTFGLPLTGDILGTWPNLYLAPDVTVTDGIKIANSTAPQLTLQSSLASNPVTFWQDASGNGNIATNSSGTMMNVYTTNGALAIRDSGTNGAAQLFLYGQGNTTPAVIWQDSPGGLYLAPGSTNGSTSVYANGTGNVNLYGNHISLHGTATGGTDAAVLDFYGPNQSSPGSIWQDQYANMWIASQVANSAVTIEAAGTGNINLNSPVKNAGMPTSAPSTGAHFVCIDDAGDMYRSDTACK